MNWPISRHLFAFFVALAMGAAGCGGSAATPTPAARVSSDGSAAPALTIQTAQVKRGVLSGTALYSGNVQARQQVNLIPKASGRVTALRVDVGSQVKAGDVLLEVEREALAAQASQAEAGLAMAQARLSGLKAGARQEQVAQAEANLDIARQRLAQLERGGRAEQVAQAEAGLSAAKAALEQIRKGATSHDLELTKLAVDQAKNALWAAQIQRDGTCGNGFLPEYQCKAADAQVAAATTALQLAETRFAQVRAGATPEQITQAEAAVRTAEEQVKLARRPAGEQDLNQARDAVRIAEAQLQLAREPITEHDLAAAEAAVAQAKAAAELAKLQTMEATLKAPFAGVIAQRMAAVGGIVGPTAPVLTLISADTDVTVNVDEASLGAVQTGQPATVLTTAYPGLEFSAKVVSVAPQVDPRSRTGQIRLAPTDADGKLRDGMFAQVRIEGLAGRETSLLVPRTAVLRESGDSVVYVVDGGKVRRQAVTLGVSEGDQIEVVAGLAEGDTVAASGLTGLRDGSAVVVQ